MLGLRALTGFALTKSQASQLLDVSTSRSVDASISGCSKGVLHIPWEMSTFKTSSKLAVPCAGHQSRRATSVACSARTARLSRRSAACCTTSSRSPSRPCLGQLRGRGECAACAAHPWTWSVVYRYCVWNDHIPISRFRRDASRYALAISILGLIILSILSLVTLERLFES